MNRLKVLASGVGLAILVAGCAAGSHMTALQPPSPPVSAPVRVPPGVPMAGFQRGIDIDLYTHPGQNFAADARADVAYIQALHANAVMVSFPVFMAGPDSVSGRAATPSPSQLEMLAWDAQAAGLYVAIRPLLDEASLGVSRTRWTPPDPAAWFASYQRFLLPYATMAQLVHIPEFFVGAEFDKFGGSSRWAALDAALRRVYHGRLAYARNWDVTAGQGGPVVQAVDSYPAFPLLTAWASEGRLTAAWEGWDRRLPAGVVQPEVGIAAARGAYRRPWRVHWRGEGIDPAIQSRWFTAACRAAVATHLGGIYFWSIGFGNLNRTTVKTEGAWANSAGAQAIAACFARLARSQPAGSR